MEKDILVSILVPNYNHAKFLTLRIESILNQTYQNFEVIIVDDCSTDNSREVIEFYRNHPKVSKILYNQTNSGSPFKQWNKGIKEAKGDFIWIAESDDYADPRLLEKLLVQFGIHSQVGIVYCQSWDVDETGEVHGTHLKHTETVDKELWKKDFVIPGEEMITKYMLSRNSIPNASAVVFKKELYEKIGGADEHYRLSGDWLVWLKMLSLTSVSFLAEPHSYFRSHTQSVRTSTAKAKDALEQFLVFKDLYTFIREKPWNDTILNHLVKLYLAACIDGKLGIRKSYGLYQQMRRTDKRAIKWLMNKLKGKQPRKRFLTSVIQNTFSSSD